SFDIAVECTGNPDGFATALAALRPKGTLVLKSTYPGALTIDAAPVVVDEIKIVGSRCGPFDKALALLSSGDFDPTELIDARYSLGDGLAAFAKDAEPGIMKVLLEMK
ncbi:MAG TPA: alcohol dehydrogenase, partial [Rhodospirillaceae bacterium]|nr:alcohol dehydrogenase [Rhodospirillaceae bacterium]